MQKKQIIKTIALTCALACLATPAFGMRRVRVNRQAVARLTEAVGNEPNARDANGITALHRAVSTRNVQDIQILLGILRASANVQDKSGTTPLHVAMLVEDDEIVETLLAHDADVNTTTADGTTPIHLAAAGGYTNAMTMLLDAVKIDLEPINNVGMSALSASTLTEPRRISELQTRLLLEDGASIQQGDTHAHSWCQ